MATTMHTRQPPVTLLEDAAQTPAADQAQRKVGGDAPVRAGLAIRCALALTFADIRYFTRLAPCVREQVAHWQREAERIEEAKRRALATKKLAAERFNAEAATMIATVAPAARRRAAVQAIVALELLFDYLDGLSEQRLYDRPIAEGEALYLPFLQAVDPHAAVTSGDPYARELAQAAKTAIAKLPARAAIGACARECARRGAEAQVRMHAVAQLGQGQLRDWAKQQAQDTCLPWRDWLAGAACSVLSLHALVAAAADPSATPAVAERIDAAYLPTCALMTLLDGIVDGADDADAGELSYAGLYEQPQQLAAALARCAQRSRELSVRLPGGAHHTMILASGVAYWLSAPGARRQAAAPVLSPLRGELRGLLVPPLLTIWAWRAAKRTGGEKCSAHGRFEGRSG